MAKRQRAEYLKEYNAKRFQEGVCFQCPNPRADGRVRCEECIAAGKAKFAAKYADRKARGACIACGKPAKPGGASCDACLERQARRHHGARAACFDHYGRRCNCCGESEPLFLCFDHVQNDGFAHRKDDRRASNIAMWLKARNMPDGFQTLCFNCNQGKRLNGGVCPHKK